MFQRIALVLFFSLLSTVGFAQSRVEIIRACQQTFTFQSEVSECVANARNARIVLACNGMTFNSGKMDCIKSAWREDVVRGCIANYTFESERLECIRQNVRPRVLQACKNAMTFHSNIEACIDKRRRPHIIRACGGFTFDDGKLECLELAPNDSELINYCVNAYVFDSERLNCITL